MIGSRPKVSALLDAIKSVTAPIGDARGLPNDVYVSDELFNLERDRILGRTWAAIGFASEVPSPGDAKPVEFMRTPLLILRDRQRQLRVFHNVCSHRGMQLVCEKTKLKAVVRCPYHSWAYTLDGKLSATPHIGGYDENDCEGFDRAKHGLKTVRFAVWMDIVFVNLSGDAESFAQFIAPLERRWDRFLGEQNRDDIRPAKTGSRLELGVDCNWKLAVENYCEAYHLPWVHPQLDTYSPLDQHFNIIDGDNMSGQGTYVYRLSETAGTRLPTISAWPGDLLQHAEYISLYPNTLLGLQADHFFAVIVIPQAVDRTLEMLQISYVGNAATDDDYASSRTSVLDSWDKVFREDVFAVEGMQSGRNSPGFDGGILTPVQDVPTHHFHSWVARRYAQALA